MKFLIEIILLILLFVYFNFYKFKRIKRRMLIKRMEVEDNINDTIDEFKKEMKNNVNFKRIQNKMRLINTVKYLFYTFFILSLILPFIHLFYLIKFKPQIPITDQRNIFSLYMLLLVATPITVLGIFLYDLKNYSKNKNILKQYIYNNFLKNLNYYIKWSEFSVDTYNLWNKYTVEYLKANFNHIQQYNENASFPSKELIFEDKINGIYKEKYMISVADFKEIIRGRKHDHILSEGIFCAIKINKNIPIDIRITNNKHKEFLMEKQYMVTTLPKEFLKDFIVLAKDGYKLSEIISAKSLEMIQSFYDNSKIKFDISIKNNEIFFRFKTIDSMEFKNFINIIDDVMLKEYANIIMFVTRLSEEIDTNWRI